MAVQSLSSIEVARKQLALQSEKDLIKSGTAAGITALGIYMESLAIAIQPTTIEFTSIKLAGSLIGAFISIGGTFVSVYEFGQFIKRQNLLNLSFVTPEETFLTEYNRRENIPVSSNSKQL